MNTVKSAMPFVDLDDPGKELEREITGWWQELFGKERIRPDQDFFALGGTSLTAARLSAKIKAKYGFELKMATLYSVRTIIKLADLIQLKQAAADRWCIVPMRTRGSLPPLFLVHGVGGDVLGFSNLVKRLPSDQPVYGIQAQALQTEGPTFIQLQQMAAYYVQQVRRAQPSGPYSFLGLSFGGLVAYEMAQQLHAQGQEVRMLGMLDTWQPSYHRRTPKRVPLLYRIYDRLARVRRHTRPLGTSSKIVYLRERLKTRILRLLYRYSAARGKANLAETMKSVRDINWIAGLNYKVLPYDGHVTLFRAMEEGDWGLPEDLGWRAMARGGVEIHPFPGDHGQVLAEPSVSHLAEKLSECLMRNNQRVEIEL
jgi:thioesterase domain-containing protein/acyl carrier protein